MNTWTETRTENGKSVEVKMYSLYSRYAPDYELDRGTIEFTKGDPKTGRWPSVVIRARAVSNTSVGISSAEDIAFLRDVLIQICRLERIP